jgi:hypothetical protein
VRRQIDGNAEVRDENLGTRDAREGVDRGKSANERSDHLRRHVAGISAHAFRAHAVIAGTDQNRAPFVRARRRPAVNRGQPLGQLFDSAQTSQRLGQSIDAFVDAERGGAINRRYRDVVHRSG